jgi:tetratricopeptide (TPR) repeat protein
MKKAALFIFLLLPGVIITATAGETVQCPNCGEYLDYLCYQCDKKTIAKDIRLDGKNTTLDYRYTVCPKCGFVVYNKNMQGKQVEEEKVIVQSDDYKNLPKNYPSHYYLAKIHEKLNSHPKITGNFYLYASFEAESVNPELVNELLKSALEYYEKALPLIEKTNEGYEHTLFDIGEMQRRLGMFELAKATFGQISVNRHNLGKIQYEVILIQKQDSDPHGMYEYEK